MRYTLDSNNTIERFGVTLLNVLDNGKSTKAFAKEGSVFSDECEVSGGHFHGGDFRGGHFYGGHFRGGDFYGGHFRGGLFHGGDFYGGYFYGGHFYGGHFRGGDFLGGLFRGGHFHGGDFRGGLFHGGDFYGGYLPLQIQGSKHFVNIPDSETIKIGCLQHDVEYWLENFERIGKIEGYTPEQIVEYKMYIDIAAKMIEVNIHE